MMGMKEKKSLFGGALRCAGIAAVATVTSPAIADFNGIPGPAHSNYTLNYASGVQTIFDYDENEVGFPADTSNFTPDVGLVAYANASAMGASANVYSTGSFSQVGAVVSQYFTVDNNAKRGVVHWDLVAGSQYANVYVYQFGTGILLQEFGGSSGSQHFVFTAGESYALIIRAHMLAPISGDSVYGVMVWDVPAPGAFALLGVAGMIGTRRRRRE